MQPKMVKQLIKISSVVTLSKFISSDYKIPAITHPMYQSIYQPVIKILMIWYCQKNAFPIREIFTI